MQKEQDLVDKFMCYCNNSEGDLEKRIGEVEYKVSSFPAEVEEAEATLVQPEPDLMIVVDAKDAKWARYFQSVIDVFETTPEGTDQISTVVGNAQHLMNLGNVRLFCFASVIIVPAKAPSVQR